MTRTEMINFLDKVSSKGIQSAILFFRSPLTGRFEERHIYADDRVELELWARAMEKEYLSKSIPFGIWINNHIEVYWKFEFTEEDD